MWIASTDTLREGVLQCGYDWSVFSPDALLLTISCSMDNSKFCGFVKTDTNSIVQEISFQSEVDHTTNHVVGGIVYLGIPIAEKLLSLHWQSPLDRCTYLVRIMIF